MTNERFREKRTLIITDNLFWNSTNCKCFDLIIFHFSSPRVLLGECVSVSIKVLSDLPMFSHIHSIWSKLSLYLTEKWNTRSCENIVCIYEKMCFGRSNINRKLHIQHGLFLLEMHKILQFPWFSSSISILCRMYADIQRIRNLRFYFCHFYPIPSKWIHSDSMEFPESTFHSIYKISIIVIHSQFRRSWSSQLDAS